jgi:type II secretory pathway component PulL
MSTAATLPSQIEIDDESRRIRHLRIIVNLSLSLIAQGEMRYEEAQELAASAKRLAEDLFPDKGHVFELLYRPQFRRMINDVYRLQ